MKKKTLIVENSDKNNKKFPIKLIITIALIILCIVMIVNIVKVYLINREFSESITEITRLNSKTVFSIDRIYLYSSRVFNS